MFPGFLVTVEASTEDFMVDLSLCADGFKAGAWNLQTFHKCKEIPADSYVVPFCVVCYNQDNRS